MPYLESSCFIDIKFSELFPPNSNFFFKHYLEKLLEYDTDSLAKWYVDVMDHGNSKSDIYYALTTFLVFQSLTVPHLFSSCSFSL